MNYNPFSTLLDLLTASGLITGAAVFYALWMRRQAIFVLRMARAIVEDHEACRGKLREAEKRLLTLEQSSREYQQVVHEMMRTL